MNYLDRSRPFGTTRGDPVVFYKQDGFDYDHVGKLIASLPGSTPEKIATIIEAKDRDKPFEDMNIHELKREANTVYLQFEAADIEHERVHPGRGMKQRLIDFLNQYA